MPSVADFLIERMENAGVKHVFGVPGDYVLSFYNKLSNSDKIKLINATDEAGAGFAADANARVAGVGAVCVTYNVGALKIANAVACAYAERSPMVVISGSPGMNERGDVLLHHMVRSFECQHEVFEKWTCASAVLSNPNRAGYEIDRVFEALNHYKQPIYIELPRDIAMQPITYDVYKQGTPLSEQSDPQNLEEAIGEVTGWIKKAKSPVILAGVELARFGLGNELVKFAEKTNIPIATTLLSKSVVGEKHPQFLGVYAGGTSMPQVQEAVEESDCLLMLGVMITDMTLSFMPTKFQKRNTVCLNIDKLKVKNHEYTEILFPDFCKALFEQAKDIPKKEHHVSSPPKINVGFTPTEEKITTARFFSKINSILDENMAIIADIGDSLFGAIDLVVHHKNTFLAPAFYTSMGTAIPGALGVQLARPDIRPLVLVGDGAFQMSCTELSTIVRNKLNPIVFVLNNDGYTTERFLLDGDFNDIAPWKYHEITQMIGGGQGTEVVTEEELETAIASALESEELFIINVVVDKMDISPALKRMAEGLSKRV